MDPPSATMPVKTSKTKQKPIDKAMQQAAAKVGAARVDEILGTISSCNGRDADTMLSTTPVKDKKARKSRKKKSSKDCTGDASPLSEEVKAVERKEATQILRAELGLLFDKVN